MTETLEYELIEISFSFGYDLEREGPVSMCLHDDSTIIGNEPKPSIQYDADGIPMGQSMEEIRMRQEIIGNYMKQWRELNPEKKRFNKSLHEDILIRQVSLTEAFEHSAKSYRSTKAVLMLDTVLTEAIKVAATMPKQGDRNQKGFEQILVMTYEDPMLGTIKLTVGVKRQSKEKVQYGITAMREGQALVNPDLVIHSKKKGQKKKAHR